MKVTVHFSLFTAPTLSALEIPMYSLFLVFFFVSVFQVTLLLNFVLAVFYLFVWTIDVFCQPNQ